MPDVRWEDDRCSWCTSTTDSGSSWTAQASSAGRDGDQHVDVEAAQRVLERDVGQRRELLVPARRHQHRLALVEVGLLDVGDQDLAGLLRDDQPAARRRR